jgi:hypothetical protein
MEFNDRIVRQLMLAAIITAALQQMPRLRDSWRLAG